MRKKKAYQLMIEAFSKTSSKDERIKALFNFLQSKRDEAIGNGKEIRKRNTHK